MTRGENNIIKGRLIVICEVLFGKVTFMDVILNLTVVLREGSLLILGKGAYV